MILPAQRSQILPISAARMPSGHRARQVTAPELGVCLGKQLNLLEKWSPRVSRTKTNSHAVTVIP